MSTLSKVKNVQGSGTFEMEINGNTVTLFKFEYEMEDGTILTANHKTDTSPFPIGSEVEYNVTKTHPEYGKSGKVSKPGSNNYNNSNASKADPKVQGMIVKQNALGHATELLKHNAIMDNGKMKSDDVMALAQIYTDWVMGAEAMAQPEKVKEAVENSTIGEEKKEEATDDLPF